MDKKIVATNKKARFNYELLENYEAGISLLGSEVKSIRAGKVDLKEGYVKIENCEIFLYNVNVAAYEHISDKQYDPLRKRKLLLHRSEIKKIADKVSQKGVALVPVELYMKDGKVKLEISLARGKKTYDKREAIKEREMKREMERRQ